MAEGKQLGLHMSGLIISKSTFTDKNNKVNHNLHIAAPGGAVNLQVGVSKDRYEKMSEMMPYESWLTYSEYKGKIYFSEKV